VVKERVPDSSRRAAGLGQPDLSQGNVIGPRTGYQAIPAPPKNRRRPGRFAEALISHKQLNARYTELLPATGSVVAALANLDPPAAQRISEFAANRIPER